jgi:hypothetical protein
MALDARVLRVRELTGGVGPPELTLVDELEAQAEADGLSGRALMFGVGLDQALWSRVRQGRRRFGVASCAKIVARYPHLWASAARYLAERQDGTRLTLLAEAARVASSARGAGRSRTTGR